MLDNLDLIFGFWFGVIVSTLVPRYITNSILIIIPLIFVLKYLMEISK